jgi:hypothetical protein
MRVRHHLFRLDDLVPLVKRAHAAERMFERTMGDFNRDWAYARAYPESPARAIPSSSIVV